VGKDQSICENAARDNLGDTPMNVHRVLLSAMFVCGLIGLVGCASDSPRIFGAHSDRAMHRTMWQVSGEETPQVPMPPPEPAPVAPGQAK
jgi:hypothetical protein